MDALFESIDAIGVVYFSLLRIRQNFVGKGNLLELFSFLRVLVRVVLLCQLPVRLRNAVNTAAALKCGHAETPQITVGADSASIPARPTQLGRNVTT